MMRQSHVDFSPRQHSVRKRPNFSSGQGTGGLPAGPAVIWLCTLSAGFNIDSFSMTVASQDLE